MKGTDLELCLLSRSTLVYYATIVVSSIDSVVEYRVLFPDMIFKKAESAETCTAVMVMELPCFHAGRRVALR